MCLELHCSSHHAFKTFVRLTLSILRRCASSMCGCMMGTKTKRTHAWRLGLKPSIVNRVRPAGAREGIRTRRRNANASRLHHRDHPQGRPQPRRLAIPRTASVECVAHCTHARRRKRRSEERNLIRKKRKAAKTRSRKERRQRTRRKRRRAATLRDQVKKRRRLRSKRKSAKRKSV